MKDRNEKGTAKRNFMKESSRELKNCNYSDEGLEIIKKEEKLYIVETLKDGK